MHPFDAAASFLSSATSAEGSFETRQQQQEELAGAGAASSLSRGTRAGGGENAGARRHDCQHRANAHCCGDRGFVCPSHVKTTTTSHVPAPHQQCSSERQQTTTLLTASASTAAVDVDVEPAPKRPRRNALPSTAAAAPTTTSSVDQPIATAAAALERFSREVRLDAEFRRVRLGGPEPEVAYYTTVTIAGHVFRGVLYDVGPHAHSGSNTGTAASDTDGSSGDEVGSSISTAGGSCLLDLTLGL